MSYCKLGADSDVYLYGSTIGQDGPHVIICCACALATEEDWRKYDGPLIGPSFTFRTRQDILTHLREHRRAGHLVPGTAVRQIEEDGWM